MENLNRIGLDSEKSKEIASLLNDILANYSTFYQNTRGYHWIGRFWRSSRYCTFFTKE